MAMLAVENLVKTFGAIHAVDGISFRVDRGEVLGFLGPNGAGKSTTMRMITGFLGPSAGTARIMDFDVQRAPIKAKRNLGYLPEGGPLYEEMTTRSFLKFIADTHGLRGKDGLSAIDRAVAATHIGDVLDQRIETLSKGFRRRVGLAQAILHDPPVLILDEPADGLDPNQKHELHKLIAEMAKRKAIVISTHILEEVEAVCSRAVIIDRGRIVADGTPDELKARSRYFNAVNLEIGTGDEAAAMKALKGLSAVDSVEKRRQGDRLHLTVIAKGGATIIDPVRQALQAAGIDVHQMAVEDGRLDDVFRMLTHGETDTGNETAGVAA